MWRVVTRKSVLSPPHDRGIDAMGGAGLRRIASGRCKVSWASEVRRGRRLYPSQSHLQLERGQVREKEKQGREKGDKAIGTEG